MISLDTETTGLDLKHGAKPFLVTFCDKEGLNTWFEWDVDPKTREPIVIYEDLQKIQDIIDEADSIVLQNSTFDVEALQTVFLDRLKWDWTKVHDTLLAGHLLASNQPHDLTSMVLIYLGINIKPYDDTLATACHEARAISQKEYPDWRIARKGLPEMPSAKEKVWKFDSWLPRAIAKEKSYPWGDPDCHLWWNVCSTYANVDSESTLALFPEQRRLLKKRGLWKIYLERLKMLPVVCKMKEVGITLSRKRLKLLWSKYAKESERAGRVCVNIAKSLGSDLELPKAGANKSLRDFVFGLPCKRCEGEGYYKLSRGARASCPVCCGKGLTGGLDLRASKSSKKTGEPSMDKTVLEEWENTLPSRSKSLVFVKSLRAYRKRKTALSYLESYQKFWLPYYWAPPTKAGVNPKDWRVLYSSLNPTGSVTLRSSSSNPNQQQVSKQEETNLRYCFGPAPGREWWSLDAKNIELRIPAYEVGETEMIDLFEKPDDPPYYGNYHLFICHILRSKQWKTCMQEGVSFKDKYETEYGYTKNFNFADQYGAVLKEHGYGTADRAAHVRGAQKKVRGRLKKIAQLGQRMIAFAQEHGYVETMPDKTVDSKRGYPLFCTRTNYNRILPTVPLSYHVQGTACWWMMKAMTRCQAYLDELNAEPKSRGYYMAMQVHDELVFDFPKRVKFVGKTRFLRNLPKIRKIQKLMEQGGDDIGVPTPCSVTYHSESWSEGVSVCS